MKKTVVLLMAAGLLGTTVAGTLSANASENTQVASATNKVSKVSNVSTFEYDNPIIIKSGVVRTHNYYGTVYALVDVNNNFKVSRYVGGNESYKYDQVYDTGRYGTYYRVSTNEWIAASNVDVLS